MDGLLIGRFQPFHNGHLHAIRHALSVSDFLILGIGSSNRARVSDNPFSAQERLDMIVASVDTDRIGIFDIPDFGDHKRWFRYVTRTLPHFDAVFTNDHISSHIFKRHNLAVYPIPFLDRANLSGTEIRARIKSNRDWQKFVPAGTRRIVEQVLNKAAPI